MPPHPETPKSDFHVAQLRRLRLLYEFPDKRSRIRRKNPADGVARPRDSRGARLGRDVWTGEAGAGVGWVRAAAGRES